MKSLAEISYDATTGIFYHKGQPHGTVNKSGYVVFRAEGRVLYAHRAAWFKHYGEWPSGLIDHVNGNRTDNRISNLRNATALINAQNTTHGTGGHFHKPSGRWKSSICYQNRQIHLGYFDTQELAEEFYLLAKELIHRPRSCHA